MESLYSEGCEKKTHTEITQHARMPTQRAQLEGPADAQRWRWAVQFHQRLLPSLNLVAQAHHSCVLDCNSNSHSVFSLCFPNTKTPFLLSEFWLVVRRNKVSVPDQSELKLQQGRGEIWASPRCHCERVCNLSSNLCARACVCVHIFEKGAFEKPFFFWHLHYATCHDICNLFLKRICAQHNHSYIPHMIEKGCLYDSQHYNKPSIEGEVHQCFLLKALFLSKSNSISHRKVKDWFLSLAFLCHFPSFQSR